MAAEPSLDLGGGHVDDAGVVSLGGFGVCRVEGGLTDLVDWSFRFNVLIRVLHVEQGHLGAGRHGLGGHVVGDTVQFVCFMIGGVVLTSRVTVSRVTTPARLLVCGRSLIYTQRFHVKLFLVKVKVDVFVRRFSLVQVEAQFFPGRPQVAV